MNEQAAVAALAGLAQAQRLRAFRALVGAGPEGMTPGALAALLGMPASTLSFHLKELMHARLVSQEREGRHLIYRPDLTQMLALMGYLSAHCCQGAAQAATGGCGLPESVCAPATAGVPARPAGPETGASPALTRAASAPRKGADAPGLGEPTPWLPKAAPAPAGRSRRR
jgi:ArsR family transcriptional regulator, arsenate/arsenite/antimonite-responsive transcriptional repressor